MCDGIPFDLLKVDISICDYYTVFVNSLQLLSYVFFHFVKWITNIINSITLNFKKYY